MASGITSAIKTYVGIGNMTGMLAGKVVVVTGAANGIGREIAITAAQNGAKAVIVGDIMDASREKGEASTAKKIEAIGVQARFIRTDVTKRSEVDELVASTDDFGGLDVMVCNAGITVPTDGIDIPEDDFDRLIAVNVKGELFGAQAASNKMRAQGRGGSIVLMSSTGGLSGAGVATGYDITKGGIVNMARALAEGLGPDNIRVNCVAPNIIENTYMLRTTPGITEATDFIRQRTPLRRLGQVHEIANTVVWLGSDLSSFISGQTIIADGGYLAAF